MSDRVIGLMTATVVDVNDPEGLGQVKVAYFTGEEELEHWARLASFNAGPGFGGYFMPDVGDEAVVGYVNGQLNDPIVLGFVWNGSNAPPGTAPKVRLFTSREGHKLIFSDEDDGEIRIEDAFGNKIRMNKDGITIETDKALNIKAGTTAIIEASGEATMKGSPIQLNP